MSKELNTGKKLFLKTLLCKGEEKIAWGNLLITSNECCTCFGNLYEYNFTLSKINQTQACQLYAGLTIEHSVDEKGAQLLLKLYEIVESNNQDIAVEQVLRFKSATRIPFDYQCENSEDIDSIDIMDDYVLIFQAKWC